MLCFFGDQAALTSQIKKNDEFLLLIAENIGYYG